MANTELSVPMGDVVVVTTEAVDGDNPDETKTQVILQLQPVQQGIYEAGSESNTAVVAVETHNLHKVTETEGELAFPLEFKKRDVTLWLEFQSDGDGSAAEVSEEVEIAYPITCGESKAILLWKKFVCPGINVKCVKFNEQLISPKQFVHLAGKSTLKDWKRAIRLGGIMLRKMMDSGQIDFYQHDKVCTNTCRSTKFDLLISSARAPVPGQQTTVVQTPTSADGNTHITITEDSTEEGIEWRSSLAGAIAVTTEDVTKREIEEISEDTLTFWKGIADVGLMGEAVSNIQKELLEMLKGVQQRAGQSSLQITDAAILNNIAQTFGLMDTVKKVLDSRKSQTEQSQEQYHSTLADLERQLEEQKKQAREQKLKAQTLQNVVLMPVNTPKPPKRPRLQRPASAAVLTPTTPLPQQQQYAVISPITIAPLTQHFPVGSLPMAAIGQQLSPVTVHTLPSSSQVFTRYATVVSAGSPKTATSESVTIHPSSSLALLSSAAVQDSGSAMDSMATVVSPVELVAVDSGLASVIQNVEGSPEETHTVIEIDPAPVDDEEAEATVVMEREIKVEPKSELETKTEHKIVAQLEGHQEQLHNVEILVIEEPEDSETK
ncbi:glucocorticoid modulatory element-binding protein 1 isoform X2 [Latimeria chalumnae]|uniref:glucocorticoid modulatory element-binding protein 1 isoform X2 n=1 Tax=Latimeria chalumnae TaxID=7897 RepID=UPI0006D92FB2|nr:PREDICTED: glucocorticoid modulatory element-binding protein 1 isoform X2 [Latimeria chalumnae]|eukprot:XP_014342224.1 PREDICTED: glucocorticoid modulatory element-binding protein 1 isoform X2 [Latimeria chalumnae]